MGIILDSFAHKIIQFVQAVLCSEWTIPGLNKKADFGKSKLFLFVMFGSSVTVELTWAQARHSTSAFVFSALLSQVKMKKGRGLTMEQIQNSVLYGKEKKEDLFFWKTVKGNLWEKIPFKSQLLSCTVPRGRDISPHDQCHWNPQKINFEWERDWWCQLAKCRATLNKTLSCLIVYTFYCFDVDIKALYRGPSRSLYLPMFLVLAEDLLEGI